QATPWFTLQSENPSWTVDENAAYLQSFAMVLAFMAGFLSLQRRSSAEANELDSVMFDSEVDL
ncbi:MAG: hypothetical protein VX068_03995, partial [Candidatus Thermoplasmatota archaeon]|nr:hypothetical protein [Candidatus Thermoplasmatota archaeon]